jgi:hypothetical protein
MPYKDEETQKEAVKFYMKRLRAKRKAEALARGEKFTEEIADKVENINYGMKPTRESPMSYEEFLAENPTLTKREFIRYKIKFASEHKWRAEKETEDKRRSFVERENYGTQNHDCILWRRMFEKNQFSDFRYNHIFACLDCQKWYARHKTDPLDLNGTKGKSDNYEELRGYSEVFKQNNPDPEDTIYTPNGAFPLNKICGFCGARLDEDGKCPNCDA